MAPSELKLRRSAFREIPLEVCLPKRGKESRIKDGMNHKGEESNGGR
jgi:hypothetical protein